MKFKIICAMCKNRGIGFQNNLPWPLFKTDMKFFTSMTTGNKNNAVIMGKNTFLSILHKINKPLSNRDNLVISTSKYNENNSFSNLHFFNDLNLMMNHCYNKQYDEIWIIGGEKLYTSILKNNDIDVSEIYLTYIDEEYECDTFFPEIPYNFQSKTCLSHVKENNTDLYFTKFTK